MSVGISCHYSEQASYYAAPALPFLAIETTMTNRRRERLHVMAQVEQQMAEAEAVLVGETDDAILLRTSELLAEHRSMLADVELKLREDERRR